MEGRLPLARSCEASRRVARHPVVRPRCRCPVLPGPRPRRVPPRWYRRRSSTATGDVSALLHARPDRLVDAVISARAAGLVVGSIYESIDVFVAFGPASVVRDWLPRPTSPTSRRTGGSNTSPRPPTRRPGDRTSWTRSSRCPTGPASMVAGSGSRSWTPVLTGPTRTSPVAWAATSRPFAPTPQFVATGLTGFTTCLGPKAYVPVPDSDTISAGGHGTHVAGIAAGDGTSSAGRFHGAAPGATIYGVSVGTTITVENGLDGLEWVLNNHDLVEPEIKVVNNSWGGGYAEYDPRTIRSAEPSGSCKRRSSPRGSRSCSPPGTPVGTAALRRPRPNVSTPHPA